MKNGVSYKRVFYSEHIKSHKNHDDSIYLSRVIAYIKLLKSVSNILSPSL